MPALDGLERRTKADPGWEKTFKRNSKRAARVAQRCPLVHVTGRPDRIPFHELITKPPYEIPTSEDKRYYSDRTRRCEDAFGLPRSAYFYAGRTDPYYGGVALAFAPGIEVGKQGSATPFDTGALFDDGDKEPPAIRCNVPRHDIPKFVQGSLIPLTTWREAFGKFLAAYFEQPRDYWDKKPNRTDLEGLMDPANGNDWRAWTFEVRFSQGQPTRDSVAWFVRPAFWNELIRMLPPTAYPPPGWPSRLQELVISENYCEKCEKWIKKQSGA